MATRAPIVQSAQPAAQVCDYCHQKPKFSNHKYCSKTCAGQAATLCNHCHKKPKFQNFDFCGKNCASQANPGGKPRSGGAAGPAAQAGAASKAPSYPKGNNFNIQKQGQPGQQTFDPLQIAQLVVQHIPQVQALLASTNANTSQSTVSAPATQPAVAAPLAPAAQLATVPNAHSNNPFLNLTNAQSAAALTATPNGTLAPSSQSMPIAQPLNISTQPSADDLECLIPGCGKPVHVDSRGMKTSDYCSMRHREEAVVSGLVSPCIMCLVLPQSETDYFCGKACREESMNKQLEID
ncbi:hypothetical protein BDQ12DRAFT_686325, partial [Crucibulum laeve]